MSVDAPKQIRTAKMILQEAYNELVDREGRMQKLEVELNETRNAIKGLRKLIGIEVVSLPPTKPEPGVITGSPQRRPGQLTLDLIECCRSSPDLLTREQLIEQLGVGGAGLSHAISTAKKRNAIIERDGAYGVPSPITTT